MLDLGPHAAFIWAAYAAVAIVIALLIVWVVVDGRRQRAMLARLEKGNNGNASRVVAS